MSAAVISLIVAICVAVFTSVTAPLLIAHRTERMHREDRLADYARQDALAARAAQAAEEQKEATREAAATLAAGQQASAERAAVLLAENNARIAEIAAETNGKLDTIHTLVNSNMTAAMQSERDATGRELAMMHEVLDLKAAAGMAPAPEALAAIEATRLRLAELDAALADRLRAGGGITGDPGPEERP